MRWRKHLPGWLYESLPYLYMGGGIAVAILLDNALGFGSGFLLLAAGAMVWSTRRTYRQASHQTEALRRQHAAEMASKNDSGLAMLVWRKEYESGQATIDTQHRRLFELGNAFLNAITEKKPKLDVELLLDELVNEVARHFATEEAMLVQVKGALTPGHRDFHDYLLTRCRELGQLYHDDEINVRELFRFVSVEVVSGHILTEDLKYLAHAK